MQVDGEPWVQGPGELVILKSALKVSHMVIALNFISSFNLNVIRQKAFSSLFKHPYSVKIKYTFKLIYLYIYI